MNAARLADRGCLLLLKNSSESRVPVSSSNSRRVKLFTRAVCGADGIDWKGEPAAGEFVEQGAGSASIRRGWRRSGSSEGSKSPGVSWKS